ncbi:MAG TPA: LysR family transcriptional regulator [Aliidongia sp.]|uniref:LysR family transcriptional regulator n=1 Tax=Aliidongia sp. TaxID=1914230 RepID=UPI002DDD4207|nr:LysR family transcriptional regulator [Aliidongia sp.]HEV2672897.1 LysR family transcriptional regulator [Aliidongia sp.]
MPNQRSLEALRAFVDGGSVSQAAVRLGRTQPQVGRLLSALEDDVGFALFDRKNRRLSLTAEGREYYAQVERVLAGHDGLDRYAAQVRQGSRDHVRVLTAPYVAHAIVADALAALAARMPGFSATIDSRIRLDIETWVGDENFDLGVSVLPISHSGIETEEFLRSEAVAAMLPTHPLAAKRLVTIDDLVETSLIATHPRSIVQQQIDRHCRERGLSLQSSFETANGMIACQLAERGLGCCISDPFVARSSGTPDLVFRRFQPRIELRYGFIFPAGRSRSKAVVELAQEIAALARTQLAAVEAQLIVPGSDS